ncbi:MAG: hypothetical protein JWM40_528 [Frankiales bacterium]|nr:hypothetical protein [Frankiales bacterium]
MIGISPSRRRSFASVAVLAAIGGVLVLPHSAYASPTPTIDAVPTVTSPGSVLTVDGSGLEDTSSLALGTAMLTDVHINSASEITGVVPHGAVSGLVHVLTTSGGSATSSLAVAVHPVVLGLTGRVGDHAALLTWTSAGSGPTLVREVTGLAGPFTPSDGVAVPVTGLSAHDTGFLNTTARTYAVWATDSDGTPSDAATVVTVAPALVDSTLTLNRSLAVAPWGRTVILSGKLTVLGLPLSGQAVDLWASGPGTPNVLVRHLKTALNGTFSTPVQPARSTTYSVRYAGDAFAGPSNVPEAAVRVLARLSETFTPSTILRGDATVLRGQVLPRIAGVVLSLQERSGASWVTTGHIRTASDGSYRLSMTPTVGVHVTRVVLPAQPGLNAAASPTTVLRVDPRNLVDGMSGNDVLALQHLLTAQHYDVGAINGRFGYDLHHAVMTFQKLQRLPATGHWGSAERLRATHPNAYVVRFPSSGRAVEIDITRQILVMSQAGVITRVIDVSTGSGNVYYQDGSRNVAHTPRGHYSIFYKINGTRISKLGALYKPSYFYQGYAVHGSASVPSYPASHGCVRITNPNADRLFPLLTYRTPVTVFDE